MYRWLLRTGTLLLWAVYVFTFDFTSYAEQELKPSASPYELIAAVNALRAAYGLPAYSISTILMTTAQSQADFMATSGSVSHIGAGGSSVTDRLLAAGYPLAGQLSLGGFRSENITAGTENTSAQAVVDQWKSDAVHLTTMISPDLTEIGAGISVNNGRAYFVIDCARPTDGGTPQAVATSIAGEATVEVEGTRVPTFAETPTALEETLVPTSVSTATFVFHATRTPTTSAAVSTRTMMASVAGILVIALICGWLFAMLGNAKK